MKKEKQMQVQDILLMPICCDKSNKSVSHDGNIILSGQSYRGYADADMSDFAVGFYEIIYFNILNSNTLLNNKGRFIDKSFAGDTMNSFNTIANKTPRAGKSKKQRKDEALWPQYLQDYYRKYHCLANFWLLPMEMGRTLSGELNKASNAKDYMDLFLKIIYSQTKFDRKDRFYNTYFSSFKSWDDFIEKHFLDGYYVNESSEIDMYHTRNSYVIISKVLEKIKKRAENIASSQYTNTLWEYFSRFDLL